MLCAAVSCAVADRHDTALLGAGLALLGLGWSAGLVAGSKLLTESLPAAARLAAQGVTDATMNLAGAAGGILAGAVFAAGTFTLLGAVAAAVVLPYVLVAAAAVVRKRKPVTAAN
jgi:MFS family permease